MRNIKTKRGEELRSWQRSGICGDTERARTIGCSHLLFGSKGCEKEVTEEDRIDPITSIAVLAMQVRRLKISMRFKPCLDEVFIMIQTLKRPLMCS